MYGIGNVLILHDTPLNTGHNTFVYGGHEGTKNLSKNGGYGQLLVLCFSSIKTKIVMHLFSTSCKASGSVLELCVKESHEESL